ncbi:phospholipid-binding protein MlaC [Vibrio cholerae]|uniref:phospholipid-binding protein MlaC n=1 Tax=Vibrio cholerae TaxID=666 RepID=UPI00163C773E|nr:phospholipid-binding protein MlaC [Vibrio cholerae]
MWKKALLLASTLLMPWLATAATIDTSNPYQMMKAVAEKSFDRLKNEQPKVHQDPQYLKVIVEEELMPYVNEQYAALKLLGPNLKGAKREDVAEFVKAFRAYLVTNYAQVLTQYTNQTIEFGPEMPFEEDRRITTVKVEILDAPRPNIKLEFKLRQEKSGEWKAFDMIAEGISLLSSKQSEWSGKIRQEGILAVAKELEQLANQPIRFESQKQ